MFCSRSVPWHFDNSFFQNVYPHLSLFVLIWVMGLSRALILTVTISTRCDLRLLSNSLGQFSEVSLQRSFRSQNWYIYSTKKSKQTMWLHWQWIRELNYDIYFVTLDDLDHVVLKSCFISCDPEYSSDFWFLPLKVLPYDLPFKAKNKKARSQWFAFQGKT